MRTFKELANQAPDKTGVYLFYDKLNRLLYVGKAKSLRNRLKSYISASDYKTSLLRKNVVKINWVFCASEDEALLKEAEYIKKESPPYNYRLGDN